MCCGWLMYTFKYKDLSKGQGGGQVFLNVKQHFFTIKTQAQCLILYTQALKALEASHFITVQQL